MCNLTSASLPSFVYLVQLLGCTTRPVTRKSPTRNAALFFVDVLGNKESGFPENKEMGFQCGTCLHYSKITDVSSTSVSDQRVGTTVVVGEYCREVQPLRHLLRVLQKCHANTIVATLPKAAGESQPPLEMISVERGSWREFLQTFFMLEAARAS